MYADSIELANTNRINFTELPIDSISVGKLPLTNIHKNFK